ncbi:DUF5076 domain-containing protein [Brevundimonas sp. GCM10030266]|uniref:DUF5076 domain-containing protein n=1 Tax=Brevundimonas sp. GCM10030266 TaxID=3273386 RepID=UPI003615DCAF
MKSIGIPPAALEDEKAVEMARVWVAQQGLHCVLNVGTYRNTGIREAKAWGIMLADMARHVTDALVSNGMEPDAASALSEIREQMQKELDRPTSKATGEFKRTRQ